MLMFFAVLLFFKEPRRSGEVRTASVSDAVKNLFTVMSNARFMLFLVIFSGYWIVYWQQYIILPIYIHGYIDARADVELILITDAATVICLQFLATYVTRKIPALHAITAGTAISAVASHKSSARTGPCGPFFPSLWWPWGKSYFRLVITNISRGWPPLVEQGTLLTS